MYSMVTASIPTEPQAIAAYALLSWFGVMIWLGNRNSGTSGSAPGGGSEASAEAGDGSGPGKPGKKKLSRAQRRRRGNIDWIQ